MDDVINILIEETNETVSISIEETTNDISILVEEVSEEVNITIQDVGIKGDDGLGAAEADDIRDRLDTLETGVDNTDYDFKTEIDTFLSF